MRKSLHIGRLGYLLNKNVIQNSIIQKHLHFLILSFYLIHTLTFFINSIPIYSSINRELS